MERVAQGYCFSKEELEELKDVLQYVRPYCTEHHEDKEALKELDRFLNKFKEVI